MATTYNFTTTDETFSVLVNGTSRGTWNKSDGKDVLGRTIDVNAEGSAVIVSLSKPYFCAKILPSDTLKINGEAYDGDFADFAETLKDDVMTVEIGVVSGGDPAIIDALPLIYIAELTPNGTDAPTATVYKNTIGAITWTKSDTGRYAANKTGAFPLGKTICPPFPNNFDGPLLPLYNNTPGDMFYRMYTNGSTDYVALDVYDAAGEYADLVTSRILVRIEVYP